MTLEEYRAAVLAEAKRQLQSAKWFKAVCMDDVNDYYPDVDAGAVHAIMQTHYWDDPHMGGYHD